MAALLIGGAAIARVETVGPSGYLRASAFDLLADLPPAPQPGDARALADRAIFRQTRALQGTPRWALATNDVKLAPADMMRDFSCSVGIALTPDTVPRTAALVRRVSFDTARNTGIAKDFYKRQRPFLINRGAVCQPVDQLKGSYDYPSGHTTAGWTWAMLLATLVPDRATAILARGRAFGESRIVCGAHNASAVEGGRLSATATLTAIGADPVFARDLATARAELDALRRDPATVRPDAATCAQETALVAQRLF
ncbi:acid phosphatase [Sphingomonas mollis]|uniref:Acid phosphatase n=1 Tax=Sphingomonas mollis TaxID=2795726 RepID=A0ABS0XUI4_9SPHN|nr:phosphatase PAP2 family protein [Sphingomonas sp. BT553]MBJ6123704.1 phosphatase PAP2 family protein [Sphingomonas sp. BT553]